MPLGVIFSCTTTGLYLGLNLRYVLSSFKCKADQNPISLIETLIHELMYVSIAYLFEHVS